MNDPGATAANPPKSAESRGSRPNSPPPSSGGSWGRVVGGLIVVGWHGGAGAYYFLARSEKSASASEKHSGNHGSTALPVEVAKPRQGGIERTTTQAGSVHAFEHASLYSKVSGFLKVQNVDIGDSVKQGQLLAVIEDPEVDKAVEQNEASLDQTRAKVKVAEAKIRSAQAAKQASEALVKSAETMVDAKTSNQVLQQKTLIRVGGLLKLNAVDAKLVDEQQDRFDVSVADAGVARAEVLSAQAEVMSKAALIEEAEANLIEAKANVEVAEANLGRAKVMQDYTRITSPYDGVITDRSFHPGDFIRSASEGGNVPVLAVSRIDKMRVVLPIPDTDVPFVKTKEKAVLQMVALPGRKFTGEVSRFSYSEDAESRNMRTEVDLPNPGPERILREGMYGRVTIILQAASPNSVTIPSSGLISQAGSGEGSVYVVKDGKAHKVDVHVGNDNGVETEILSGLSIDDEVITSYNGPMTEGTPVKGEMKKSAEAAH